MDRGQAQGQRLATRRREEEIEGKTKEEVLNHLSSSKLQAVTEELGSGETLQWTGQPNPKVHLNRSLGIFLFAIPWTAFSLFWIAGAAGFKIPDFSDGFDFFPLFGLPFLLIGIGMLSSPYFSFLSAKRTTYAVTNERAFELKVGKTKKIKNYPPETIEGIEKVEKPDGSGNVLFSSESRSSKHGTIKVGFIGINDVRGAEQHIRNLRREKG